MARTPVWATSHSTGEITAGPTAANPRWQPAGAPAAGSDYRAPVDHHREASTRARQRLAQAGMPVAIDILDDVIDLSHLGLL